jgi:hypothetical protein
VDFARERGTRAVEGYSMTTTDTIEEELPLGIRGTFAAAGFREVSRPTLRRLMMRIDFWQRGESHSDGSGCRRRSEFP